MNKVSLSFNLLQARFLIEACAAYEERLRERARVESDEDEQADLSNDSGYVGSLCAYVRAEAEEAFGSDVTSFSRPPTF